MNTTKCSSPGRPVGHFYAGFILGFPGDTPERIAGDIRTMQQELPVDLFKNLLSKSRPSKIVPRDPEVSISNRSSIC